MVNIKAKGIVIKENPDWLKLIHILKGHKGPIGRIAWSPDGRIIATPSEDKSIKLWDGSKGTILKTLKGHSDRVIAVDWSPNGSLLASSSDDGTIRLWDICNYEELRKLDRHRKGVRVVRWSFDGNKLVSASNDNQVLLWSFSEEGFVLCENFLDIQCFDILWAPDSDQFVLASREGLLFMNSTSLLLKPYGYVVI